MKILYISFFYPPFNTIGGMRSFGQVKALTDMGCDVKVISCADQGFEINHDFDKKSLSNVIYKNKPYSSRLIKIIDSASKLSSRKKFKTLALRLFPKFLLRMISLFQTLIFFGQDNPGWIKAVLQDYKKDLGDWSPDIVFSTFSPIDSHIIASKISSNLNIRWAAEFRDCWSFNTMLFSKKESELSAKILRAMERKILSNCSIIFAATPFIKTYYERHHLKETELLLGGWEEQNKVNNEKPPSQNYIFDDTNRSIINRIKILHLGSMLHGTRSILPIVQMLEGNPALKERFEFEFVGRDSTIFQPILNKSSAKDSITLFDHVSFNEAEKLGYSSDILLVMMKNSSMEKYTLTGKIFEYIKFSKPIISLDPYNSEVSALIKKYKLGYHVKNIDEFQYLLKSKSQLSEYKKADEKTRLEFKRANQMRKVLKRLKDFA